MKKLYFMILFLLCTAIFSSCSPSATPAPDEGTNVFTEIPTLSLDELIYGSDAVFEGTVTDILPSHRNIYSPSMIQTDIIITPDNILLGEERESFTVRIGSGKIGSEMTVDDAFPQFREGEKLIVFINSDWNGMKSPDDTDIFALTGSKQGKFEFVSESNDDENIYRQMEISGESHDFTPSQLKSRIEELRRADPDMDAKRAAEKQRSIEAGRNSIAEMEAAKAAASMFPGSAE